MNKKKNIRFIYISSGFKLTKDKNIYLLNNKPLKLLIADSRSIDKSSERRS